jgi:hypothetical protein
LCENFRSKYEDFRFYRRLLAIFNDPRLFTVYPDLLISNENKIDSISEIQLNEERNNFSKWNASVADSQTFIQLPASSRHNYLLLWTQSPLNYKRAFYRASKLMIYASVLSQEHFYSAIGYAGPLLKDGNG